MVGGGVFSWHTLGPLVAIEHRLNATVCLSIVSDHVHLFMTTVYHLLIQAFTNAFRLVLHVTINMNDKDTFNIV